MSLWDWLSGKPKTVTVADDLIWMNQSAKFGALRRAVENPAAHSVLALIVAHFAATLTEVRKALQGLPVQDSGNAGTIAAPDVLRSTDAAKGPRLVLSGALATAGDPSPVADEPGSVSILVAERHFLQSHDDRIVDFARALGPRCRITYYSSLHDPFLRTFAGGWVENLLSQLGMTESESIESRMVARRLRKAQALIAGRVSNEQPAESAEEWLKRNVVS